MEYRLPARLRIAFVLAVLFALSLLSCRTAKTTVNKSSDKVDSSVVSKETIVDRTDSVHISIDTGRVVREDDYEVQEETWYKTDSTGKATPVYTKKVSKGKKKEVEQKATKVDLKVNRDVQKKSDVKANVKRKVKVKDKDKTVSSKGKGIVVMAGILLVVVLLLFWFFGKPKK